MLVAVRQGGGHLAEEPGGLGLREAPPAAHQAVHVPMWPREEGVEVLRARQDLHRPGHVALMGQPPVGLQHRQALAGRVHLWAERGVTMGGDSGGRRQGQAAGAGRAAGHSQSFRHCCGLGPVPSASTACHSILTKLRASDQQGAQLGFKSLFSIICALSYQLMCS